MTIDFFRKNPNIMNCHARAWLLLGDAHEQDTDHQWFRYDEES
jgi:hypothetical protein